MTLTIVFFFFCYITLFAIKNKLQSKDKKKIQAKIMQYNLKKKARSRTNRFEITVKLTYHFVVIRLWAVPPF